ncbi:hypothetical protein ACSSS7_000400 [Eimeria intestinalis]
MGLGLMGYVLCALAFFFANEMTLFPHLSESSQVDVVKALRAQSRSVQRTEPSRVSDSSLISTPVAAARRELALPSRKLLSPGGPYFKLFLTAFASAAAIAVLISLCAALHLRAEPSELTRRGLSEQGPPESSRGLAACGETIGDSSGEGAQASPQDGELVPPPAKKAKVEGEGSRADAEASSVAQTFGSGQQVPSSAGGGVADGAAPVAPAAEPTFESPTSPLGEVESPTSPLGDIVAQALSAALGTWPPVPQEQPEPAPVFEEQWQLAPIFEQQDPPGFAFEQQVEAVQPVVLSPALPGLAAATVTTPMFTPAPAEVEGLQPQVIPIQLAAPLPGWAPEEPPQEPFPGIWSGSRAELTSSNSRLEMIDPLSYWEPPHPSEAGGEEVVEHAFSRLPRVEGGDPSAYRSLLDPERAIRLTGRATLQVSAVRTLSALLAQDELFLFQLPQFVMLTEHLLGHLAFHESRPLSPRPSYALEVLGFRFLLMDMAVSALQLLGVPPSGPWWDHMVSQIPDEYIHPVKRAKELVSFNINLMRRLTVAIRELKSGHRPSPHLLVHLKRCLFCCVHSPLRFLRPAFDRWREDDNKYYQQFEGRPRQEDSAQPGPSHRSDP